MDNKSNYKYLLSDLSILNGVGNKTTNLLKKKNINNIFDLLWNYLSRIQIEVYHQKSKI